MDKSGIMVAKTAKVIEMEGGGTTRRQNCWVSHLAKRNYTAQRTTIVINVAIPAEAGRRSARKYSGTTAEGVTGAYVENKIIIFFFLSSS